MIHHINAQNQRRPASANDQARFCKVLGISQNELNLRLRTYGIVSASGSALVNSAHREGQAVIERE